MTTLGHFQGLREKRGVRLPPNQRPGEQSISSSYPCLGVTGCQARIVFKLGQDSIEIEARRKTRTVEDLQAIGLDHVRAIFTFGATAPEQ
jgi:hypothetical protein